MKTFLIRVLSGAIYVAILVGSLLFNPQIFAFVLLFLALVGTYEFQRFSITGKRYQYFIISLSLISFILGHLIISEILYPEWLAAYLLLPLILGILSLYIKFSLPIGFIAKSLLNIVYTTLPLLLMDYLSIHNNILVLLVLIIIWINDSFAYLTGMLIGRNKLFERVSPKKTWEGFIGGLIFSIVISVVLFKYSGLISMTTWLILVVLIVLAAVFGDFVESLFKRQAGIKDSGSIMPGHGGILDRIDSILFVFPVVFVYFQLFV